MFKQIDDNQEQKPVGAIVPFAFESVTVRTIQTERGEVLFVAKDVATALGYGDPTTAVKSHCRGVQELHPILDALGRTQEARVIREADVYRLIFGSTLPSAQEFERLVTEEVLPAIRKTGQYTAGRSQPSRAEAMLMIAESAARMLRLSDTSKVRMLSTIAKEEGLPTSFLPVYVDEPLVRSLTALLKEHGVLLSAVAAYPKLEGLGIVERLTRIGSKGTVKKFWSLTPAGLHYGRNENHPNNPRETQPLFYAHLFSELLGRLQ